MFVHELLFVAASLSITLALSSPCPDLFHYHSEDQPGRWTGTVTFLSESELHGVWARFIFDEKLTELSTDSFGEVVASDDGKEYLIKNRDVLLKAGTPTNVKINVKYGGDKVPKLISYRLNAKVVCSEQETGYENLFAGDLASTKDFVNFLVTRTGPTYQEPRDCGTVPLKSQEAQWPWQAAIYVQNGDKEEYICGATLVSPSHVLTAAHCVTYKNSKSPVSPQYLTVHLGEYHPNGDNATVQKLKVQKIDLYPGYRANSLLDDLAVVRLDEASTVNDYVRPVCLDTDGGDNHGVLVGYGFSKDQKIVKVTQAKVSLNTNEECSKAKPDLKAFLVDPGFCASYVEDNPICVGDSGSGLVSLRAGPKPVWELRGVVTLSVPLQNKHTCNKADSVLLVDVSKYLRWIQALVL